MFVYSVVDQDIRNLTLVDLIISRVVCKTNEIKISVMIFEINERLTHKRFYEYGTSFQSIFVFINRLLDQLLSFTDQLFQGLSPAKLKWNEPLQLDNCKTLCH